MEPLTVRVEDLERGAAEEHAFARSPVRIGRSERNDLCLPHRFVSAWHGLLAFDDAGARYTDLGSTNGSLLDGSQLAAHEAVPLASGAEIVIGSLRITFPGRGERRFGGGARPTSHEPDGSDASAERPTASDAPLAGGITAIMRKLAAAPAEDLDLAWRRVLLPGTVIGRFELVREVDRGSCGVVFEAKDRQLGRLVAFKAVRPGRDSQVMLRQELLQKEAEAAAQLNHPNIVSLYDVGTCESGPYLIMELLRGENLRARMQRQPLPLAEALEIAIQIAWALDHAHAAGVVHRDLKPANVFLCAGGQVKVLDFGIAHVFGTGSRRAVGTPAYMAPEQWRHGPQDPRTDVFGAAATLAEMVTGRLPYRVTGDWSAVLEPGARPRVEGPAVPPQLEAVLRRGLSPSPEGRPHDGHAWLAALLEVLETLDSTPRVPAVVSAKAPGPARTPPRARGRSDARTRRTDALVLAGVAVTLAASALAYLLFG